ncbi:MAG: ribosome biogenesis GTPase YlqF [Firmicutes bacterium]|nr:ribosome biogenesis GTPase YlqF [Bacillota bacterium]
MEIQWYPGHMAKAKRELKEILPLLDIIIEVTDARIPKSSRNPDLINLTKKKPRLLLLNKVDLADPIATDQWINHYRTIGEKVIPFNGRTGDQTAALEELINQVGRETLASKAIWRLGVVGVPNCGKSSVLNRLARRSAAQVGERPGVTRGRQWVRRGRWEILDTPGMLWPKIGDVETGLKLALVGTIKPENLEPEELTLYLLGWLQANYPASLHNYYGLTAPETAEEPYSVLLNIGKRRGCLRRGGEVDLRRTAELIGNDFRQGKLGTITLETTSAFPVSS